MNNWQEGSWEHAAYDIIVSNGFDVADGTYTDFKALFRRGMYAALARQAWGIMNEATDTPFDANEMVTLLAGKQHDYGCENILEFGEQGIVVRLWDKISRYYNLLKRGEAPWNESLRDTLCDMVGYCVLWTMVKQGVFTLPLAGDL